MATNRLLQLITECTNSPSEAVALNALDTENRGGSSDVPKTPGPSAQVDALAAGEPMVSSADVHIDKVERPGTEVKGQWFSACAVSQPLA